MRKQNKDEQLVGFVYFDVMLQYCVLVLFFFMLTILLPHKKGDEVAALAGRVCAELYWDNSRNVDLDIWGKGPNDLVPVYYHSMHSRSLDLMRDVTGFSNNPEHLNMELMCANQLIPGEYTFNVKYFGNAEAHMAGFSYAIDATMIIRIKKVDGTETILRRKVPFVVEKEEHTMFNFRVDDYGHLIKESVNFQETPL